MLALLSLIFIIAQQTTADKRSIFLNSRRYLYDTHMIFCKAHMIQKRLSDFCTTENNIKSCFDNLYFNKALLDSNNPIQKSNSCMKTIAFQGLFIL
ncbi:hypothetical protein C4181_21715 [Clostridioides difficile]|nr:hypothetical protein [Clostridioides difficile]